MKRAETLFNEAEKQAVTAAVQQAEGTTSGEIVPVVATVSGRYDRAEDIVGLLFGLLALAAAWRTCPYVHPSVDWAEGIWLSSRGLWPALLCVAAGFILGSALATWIPALRLPFILAHEMDEDVQRAAHLAFDKYRVHRTRSSTGILIFVSLYERRVVVLPDQGLAAKIPADEWASVRDLVIDGLKRHRPADGLSAAILKCGAILAQHAPREADDRNELINELRLVDAF